MQFCLFLFLLFSAVLLIPVSSIQFLFGCLLVYLLSFSLSWLHGMKRPGEEGLLQLDESAINKVCEKILDNYFKWCEYILKRPVYSRSVIISLSLEPS